MKPFPVLIPALFLLVFACHGPEKEKSVDTPATDTTRNAEKKDYFPVADYIRSEIAYVDSFPLRIVKYSTQNGHKDSAFIRAEEFDRLARQFLDPELEKSSLEKSFSENSFMDQTSQSVTFTYSKNNDQPGLRRIDVLASPDAGFDKVKSIYIERTVVRQDSSYVEKMYWKARKNFQVITMMQSAQQPASQLKVSWDDHD